MAETREHDRTKTPRRAGGRKRIVLGRSGSRNSPDEASVSVSGERFVHIAGRSRQAAKVLAGYADTVAEAARVGRSVDITFRVSPDGEAESVVAVQGDALDAALAEARVRGRAKVAEILKGEDMLTARAFGALIGASHETVNARRRRFQVLGLEGAVRGVKYPRWQVTEAGLPLPGLPQVFAALGEQPWTVYRFLRTAQAELGAARPWTP